MADTTNKKASETTWRVKTKLANGTYTIRDTRTGRGPRKTPRVGQMVVVVPVEPHPASITAAQPQNSEVFDKAESERFLKFLMAEPRPITAEISEAIALYRATVKKD